MIFKRAKKEPEAAPPMDLEACKKLIYRDYVYGNLKPELRNLVDAKDKSLAAALLMIACAYDEQNWPKYKFDYALPACSALKAIGDASAAGPVLEFLAANHARDDYQNPFAEQLELLDALVAPADWGPYRDSLERLSSYGGHLGKFGALRLSMLEAVQAGTYERIMRAGKDLARDSSREEFAESLSFLEADRSDLAVRTMLQNSSGRGRADDRAAIVDEALARIPEAAIPRIERMRREAYDVGGRAKLTLLLEKIGEPAAPALIAIMKEEKDEYAYEALKRLFAAGRMRSEDKQALWALKGMTLRSHSDNTANCGVHLDTPGADVEL